MKGKEEGEEEGDRIKYRGGGGGGIVEKKILG